MRLANYFLLMYLAANGLINAAQTEAVADPKTAKPDEGPEPTPTAPVLFTPLHGPRSLAQQEHKLFGNIRAGKDSHAVDKELLQKLLHPSEDAIGVQFQAGGSTFVPKKSAPKVKSTKPKTPKAKGGRNLRGLETQLAEVDHDIQDILLESPDGYAILAVIPEQNLIVSGHIEQRINGTLGTTYTFIHGPDDPNDPTQSYDITILDRETQLARTDSGPEHVMVPQDDQTAGAPEHGRRLDATPSSADASRIFTIALRYTPETAATLGSDSKMRANAVQIVSSINYFLSNSGVSNLQTLQLGSVEVSELHDSGDPNGSLYSFSNLPSSLSRNEDYAMLITNGFACGIGYLYGAYTPTPDTLKKYLTTVVNLSCAIVDKSAAHEKGHNEGLQHDRGNAGSPYRSDFANGYAMMDQYGITGTILAYTNNKADRYPFYSSAQGTFNINGQPIAMGSPTTDNVGVLKISLPEIYRALRGGSVPTPGPAPTSRAPTVHIAPTHSAGQPTRFPTPASVPTTKRPTTAKPTPRPVVATYRPTAATKRPTVPTKRPTAATKGPTVPTKGPTKRPTTAAPTFDQTPSLALGQTVNFAYDAQTPAKPLVLKIGPSRTLTLGTKFSLTNNQGVAVKPANYEMDSTVYAKMDFSKDINFKVVNTDPKIKEADGNQYVYIYYLPPKPKGKHAKTPKPQLLIKLQKNDITAHPPAQFIDDTFTVAVGSGSSKLQFGATGSVTPPPTKHKRGLSAEDVVLDIPNLEASIDFVQLGTDLANKSPAEHADVVKEFIENNTAALDIIADDWILMHKFMVDTMNSLGPYEASKFLREGVLTELFTKADAETICNAFEVSRDPFLNALCLEYVDNAAETFAEKPSALAEASEASAILQFSIPNFIRDVVQARLVAESVENMENFFNKKGALSSEDVALADMFRFAKIDDVVELFKRLATEDKYRIIKFVPEDVRKRNDYLVKIHADELEGKWEQVGHGRYEKTGRAKPRKS